MTDKLTYEAGARNTPLETYEWDDVWWEHADDTEHSRVLYIGDSISVGIRGMANNCMDGSIYFDSYATSKAIDNPHFTDSIALIAKQQGYRSAVLFNNGHHGWHLSMAEYAENYEKTVKFLIEEFGDTPVILVTTTALDNAERLKATEAKNEIVKGLAEKYSLNLIDIFELSKTLEWSDGIHFKEEGYRKLTEKILTDLKKII